MVEGYEEVSDKNRSAMLRSKAAEALGLDTSRNVLEGNTERLGVTLGLLAQSAIQRSIRNQRHL